MRSFFAVLRGTGRKGDCIPHNGVVYSLHRKPNPVEILKKLVGGKEDPTPQNDPFANAPVFKKMMEDMKKEQDAFEDIFNKIVPIVKPGKSSGQPQKVMINGVEHEMPQQSLPVTFPIPFDELSIIFGIDRGSHYE